MVDDRDKAFIRAAAHPALPAKQKHHRLVEDDPPAQRSLDGAGDVLWREGQVVNLALLHQVQLPVPAENLVVMQTS